MIAELMTALASQITGMTITMSMTSPSGAVTAPAVYIGALPPKDSVANQQDFPCVIVRPVSGTLSRTEIVCDVHFICGAYIATDSAADGVSAVHQLADVCLGVMASPGPIGDKWVLDRQNMSWDDGSSQQASVPEMGGQPHPFYFVTIKARYRRSYLDHI